MTAEIIQLGSFARPARQIVPIGAGETKRKATSEDREARAKEWTKADLRTRYYREVLNLLDVTWLASDRGVTMHDIDRAKEFFPIEWEAHLTERNRVLEYLVEATVRQLRQPAAFAQHVSWKQVFARGGGFPCTGLTKTEIDRLIALDEHFLATCPRKSGGKRPSRAEMHGGDQ
jgi:hypothetical protein